MGEFLFIIGDDGVTKSKRLSRNEQFIGPDWSASLLKPRTQQSVGSICGVSKGKISSAPSTASSWAESRR